jgi:sensor domain CHASE-containing protein/nitrogen-specific signal transduction histidine kinase
MSIRRKTLLIISTTTLFLVLLLYGTSETFLLGNFANLEQHMALKNVDRVQLALSYDIDQLNSTVSDWAPWDATYKFIMDRNQNYINRNLDVETLSNLRLNLVLFIDTSGHLVFAKAVDFQAKIELPISQNLLSNLFSKGNLICHNESDRFKGIVLLPEGPILISSQPILTSTWKGPVRGTLIMGRYLDSELKHLSELTQLPLNSSRVNDAKMSSDFAAAQSFLSKERPVLIKPLSEDSIAGYTLIPDVYGDPALILRADMLRDIHRQGQATNYYHFIFILLMGMIFAAVTLILFDRTVLSRIGQLSSNVRSIGLSGDVSTRVGVVSGKDELSSLAVMINDMLDKIDESEGKLRRSERMAAIGKTALMVGHDLRNPLQTIVVTTYLAKAKIDNLPHQERTILENQGLLEDLRTIDKHSNYMNKIVSDLQDYARPLIPEIEDIELHPFVKNVLAEASIPEDVEVQTEIEDGLTWKVDQTMMERVLTNIVTNAVQAMPNGGKLVITGASSEEDTTLTVTDTGEGIPPEHLSKIFDPLFTTKSKGMGMGLVVSKRLVESQGGSLRISSVLGKGTIVEVRMPIRKLELGG